MVACFDARSMDLVKSHTFDHLTERFKFVQKTAKAPPTKKLEPKKVFEDKVVEQKVEPKPVVPTPAGMYC